MKYVAIACLSLGGLFAASAPAAIVLDIADTTFASSGSVQNFVLDLTFSNDGAPASLQGYDVALEVSGTGLTITGVGTGANKVPSPVLPNDPAYLPMSGKYLFSDVSASAGSIDDGDGLFRVLLQAAPNASGVYTISFYQNEADPLDTKLYSNVNLDEVPNLSFTSGIVTITVPEPTCLALLGVGGFLAFRRRRA